MDANRLVLLDTFGALRERVEQEEPAADIAF
jgi:hypothetical protein